jgi:N-acetyl-gamma-glutamyl-phosphate reductase
MIADYESAERSPLLGAPRQYALAQSHKHLPEMMAVAGLENAPVFCPVVGDFYSGMEVTVPVFAHDLSGTVEDVKQVYRETFENGLVRFVDEDKESGFLSAAAFTGRDDMEVRVCGNAERVLLVARFDNLGKGASGAAIQNMNIMLGVDETTGLIV